MEPNDVPFDPEPGGGSPWGDLAVQPSTWPRRRGERYQPRTRLTQALDVASHAGDAGRDPWQRRLPAMASVTPLHEIEMFPTDEPARADTPATSDVASLPAAVGHAEFAAASNAAVAVALDEPSWVQVPEAMGDGTAHEDGSADGSASPYAAGAQSSVSTNPANRNGVEFGPEPFTPESSVDEFGPAGEHDVSRLAVRELEPEEEPFHLVVDLRPKSGEPEAESAVDGAAYGLGRRWGVSWRSAAQGWVDDGTGQAVWRPVVTTTTELASWDVDTYLGVVTAEVAVEAHGGDFRQLGATLAEGREVGTAGLVEEAVERGAHGVIGVAMHYTPIGGRLLITITGTAVTLRPKAPALPAPLH